MWYRCEAMGQSNQVDQLKLLQKITLMKNWFLWRHVKKRKNANRVLFINHIPWLKCLIFLCFWVELCKTLEKDGQEIKISTRMKKFHFWVKYAVFIKNKNEFFEKNSDFWYTWSNDHIQQLFQISERSDQYCINIEKHACLKNVCQVYIDVLYQVYKGQRKFWIVCQV